MEETVQADVVQYLAKSNFQRSRKMSGYAEADLGQSRAVCALARTLKRKGTRNVKTVVTRILRAFAKAKELLSGN